MSDLNFNDIQDYENNYELKKALNKLENALQKKEYEISSITNLYQDLKNLNGIIKKESNDLTNKLNSVRNAMNIMEKKHQNEMDTIKSDYMKKQEIYENKLLKLSEYNPDRLRKNIEIEIQNKFKQQVLLKDKEIEELTQKLNKSKHANELLETEYETYKSDISDEINTLKQMHKNEVNILMEKRRISENNGELLEEEGQETVKQLKNELDTLRRHITELNNEIDKLRHDKEILTIERNEYKLSMIKIRDNQNFNQKKLELEYKMAQSTISNYEKEINSLNNKIKIKDIQINSLLKENDELNDKINHNEMNFQEANNNIQHLKKIMKKQEEKINKNLSEREKNSNELILKEQKEKEEYQKQIDELNIKLKEAKSDDMIQKEKEINKLKDEIRLYKKEMQYDNDSKSYKELNKKLKEMIIKKDDYKLKCKMANENIQQMIELLNEEQQQKFDDIIRNNKKKYMNK